MGNSRRRTTFAKGNHEEEGEGIDMMAKRPKLKPVQIMEENQKAITLNIVYRKTSINPDDLETMSIFFFMTCTVSVVKSKRFEGITLSRLSNGKIFMKSDFSCVEVDLVEGFSDCIDLEFGRKRKVTTEEASKLVSEGARYFGSESFNEEGSYIGKF
jgi:hypothetical protein